MTDHVDKSLVTKVYMILLFANDLLKEFHRIVFSHKKAELDTYLNGLRLDFVAIKWY